MTRPTHIEALDRRLPGLADAVKAWFNQGVPVRQVVELIRRQYHIAVPRSTLGNFRARRWARDRELRLEKEPEARATADGADESIRQAAAPEAIR